MLLNEKFEVHDTLNPKIWTNNQLNEDVKEKLKEIIDQFISSCEVPLHIVDVHIVGSQASFNYTKYSDLDVHLICNFELIECSKEVLQTAYNAVKTKFNSDYNITIHGIDVELYIEDIRSSVMSNGIYSLYTNSWIKFPKKLYDVPQVNIDSDLATWEDKIQKAIATHNSDAIENVVDELYTIRKTSLDVDGEYGKGNQLFKEIRNLGLLDALKNEYKKWRSKELSLESLHRKLNEDSRSKLLAKSKQSKKGLERFKKRVKSRIANSVKQFNAIDMNKLFKDDILTVDINVTGESDSYIVKISFGGFCEILQDQINKQGKLDYKAVTRALIIGFNRDDVYIRCNCADAQYRFAYWQSKNNVISGDIENRPSNITNPDDALGSACKHVLLVLSNTSFLLKVASTIYNYINYMEKHYQRLYADIIYPAIYGKSYEEPVQLDMFDDDALSTDADTIDKSNTYARTKNQFKSGNKEGIRFSSKDNQTPIEDVSMQTSNNLDTSGEDSLEV